MSTLVAKTYVKDSNITGIGKGLFAATKIQNDDVIVEFTGKLLAPKEKLTDRRSNILFNDGYKLQCDHDDLASYANDLIDFPKKKRYLLKNLLANKPFYNKHPNTCINAIIIANEDEHRAFLIACDDILPNDEIYVHYGFMYWIKSEFFDIGFLDQKIISQARIPIYLSEYDAFFEYVKVFYPKYVSHEIISLKGYDRIVLYSDTGYYNTIFVTDLNISC